MNPLALGPFDVRRELARGGMGVVFEGAHRAGVPVAIKVIDAAYAAGDSFHEDFRREVQAAARLSHPNVVTLLEYGTIPEEAARASQGAMVRGSPFLVMEMADAGSLADAPPGDWPTLKRHLEALLDALAHAHAHGLTHRDLKPGNVLLHRGAGSTPCVKLADFGIAHASDRRQEGAPDLDAMTGTPQYMPPEQIQCLWRDYGPWTDLYALGIMTWQLACGRLPFVADVAAALLFMHLAEPLPPLAPRFACPHGLGEWLARLCHKDPRSRFRRAADARAALGALEATPEVRGDAPPWAPADSVETAPELSADAPPWASGGPAPMSGPAWASPVASPPARPPIPERWQAPRPPALSLHGAGLGLYFLRSVPMVDRDDERGRLWSALRACEAEGKPRAVVLRGPSGTGKSRLARWLCERSHETGAATPLRAAHEESPGASHGLPRMLALHYRAAGLSGDALQQRLASCLEREGASDAYDRDALFELLGGDGAERSSVRFSSPTERHVAVEAVLARAAAERAVVVWLDDVQWGGDSIAMVEHALASLDAPVLFVLTARDDLLGERERERERLEALSAHPRALRVDVGALPDRHTATLIEQLLGLSGELAQRVRARVGGNPLFAVQLVGDWVQRGMLEPTPKGFALRPGERGELPDDLHAVWLDRVERVLAQHEGERELLELAATLGPSVDRAELDAASDDFAGRGISEALLEALLRAHLIEPTETGFAFAHGMLRESLARAAAEAGRGAAMHACCARMLEGRTGRGLAARRGHHLAEAGELEAALEPLLVAAREHRDASDYPLAWSALARREELLARLALAESDERWGLGWVVRADVHRMEWDFAAAERWAENALSVAEAHGWARVRAEALHVLSHVARQHGDLDRAQERNRRALDLFDRLGDDEGRARTLLAMAIVTRQQGAFDRAEELYRRAFDVFELIGDERGAGNALLGQAHVARHHKAYADAEAKYEAARALFEGAGYRSGVSHCLMGRADVQRYQGELAQSEAGYAEALRIQTRLGSKATFIAHLNLGLVQLAQDRVADARAVFEGVLEVLAQGGKDAYVGLTHTCLLPCAVELGDLDAFDAHLEGAERGARSLVDEDMAAAAERAGRALLDLGEHTRAAAALRLADAQWRALGDEARAEAVRAVMPSS